MLIIVLQKYFCEHYLSLCRLILKHKLTLLLTSRNYSPKKVSKWCKKSFINWNLTHVPNVICVFVHVSFLVILDEIPDMSKELTENPETVINCFGLAMHQVICSTNCIWVLNNIIKVLLWKLPLVPSCHRHFLLRPFHVADIGHRPWEWFKWLEWRKLSTSLCTCRKSSSEDSLSPCKCWANYCFEEPESKFLRLDAHVYS